MTHVREAISPPRGGPLAAVRVVGQGVGNRPSFGGGLSDMYQRIPTLDLESMKRLKPLNVAVFAPPAGTALPPSADARHSSRSFAALCTWTTRRLTTDATLSAAFAVLASINSSTPLLARLQLNFSNSAHATFARQDPTDASALAFVGLYDPAATFVKRTRDKAERQRRVLLSKLEYIAGDAGHLNSRPPSPGIASGVESSLSRQELYKKSPAPTTGRLAGFAFTPMSFLSFEHKPNTVVTGCRPGIRETNAEAVHYRPRLGIVRPATPVYETFTSRYQLSPVRNGQSRSASQLRSSAPQTAK